MNKIVWDHEQDNMGSWTWTRKYGIMNKKVWDHEQENMGSWTGEYGIMNRRVWDHEQEKQEIKNLKWDKFKKWLFVLLERTFILEQEIFSCFEGMFLRKYF